MTGWERITVTDLLRDVYPVNPPVGTAEHEIQVTARAARHAEESMRRCAAHLSTGRAGTVLAGREMCEAEDRLRDAIRRCQRLRKLLAAREEDGYTDVREGQVWQPRDPGRDDRRLTVIAVTETKVVVSTAPARGGTPRTVGVPRAQMAIHNRLIEETPDHTPGDAEVTEHAVTALEEA
ncbi:hypothetical protein [Sphaerisporangium sp. TRM90804]|uniref:hypothetical protein n=1 Tax=Sphaerisporangium sp. TRM90804 TaxID=3031113 RepID=UPI0024496E0B|nr:hypothetical protein [Sphaerisporangium sp. TRM90804]MDH2424817.1 hypothetical protein [Sphaerisporangium sp. TRM90804]